MDITRQVIEEAAEMLAVNLRNYGNQINTAFLKADDDFKVGLSLTFKPCGSGIEIKSEISFVPERVKDGSKKIVSNGRQLTFVDLTPRRIERRVLCGSTPGLKVRSRWYSHR